MQSIGYNGAHKGVTNLYQMSIVAPPTAVCSRSIGPHAALNRLGEEAQRELEKGKEALGMAKGKASKTASDAESAASKAVNSAKETAQQTADSAKQTAQQARHRAGEAAQGMPQDMHEAQEQVKEGANKAQSTLEQTAAKVKETAQQAFDSAAKVRGTHATSVLCYSHLPPDAACSACVVSPLCKTAAAVRQAVTCAR
jgi:vacuolar-type H+-ATPase subunit H